MRIIFQFFFFLHCMAFPWFFFVHYGLKWTSPQRVRDETGFVNSRGHKILTALCLSVTYGGAPHSGRKLLFPRRRKYDNPLRPKGTLSNIPGLLYRTFASLLSLFYSHQYKHDISIFNQTYL